MNKKVLVSVLGILGIIVATFGVTYAFFSYSKTGTTPSTIRSGAIEFKYKEGNRKIELTEVMPMTDAQGKKQSNYFDFEISAKTSRTLDIPYDITVRKATGENILSDSIIKVYLTKVSLDNNENEVEDEVLLTNVSSLNGYTNNKINIPATEKLLYTSSVKAGDTNYNQKYRIRMWVDTTAEYINQTSGVDTYPLQGKTYSLTVNVYGEGLDIGESGVATRQNTNISSMSFSDSEDEFTLENGVYTTEVIIPEGETTMTKTIVVATENPNATVTYQKVDEFEAVIPETGIKRLSTSLQLPLEIGTNNFIITVKGEDGRTTNEFNLSIEVSNGNFATDDWATIIANVRKDGGQKYAPVSGGIDAQPLKAITMTIDGVTNTYHLRVANTTRCEDLNPAPASTTSCGFVIEFADVISAQQMNTEKTNVGGYPGSDVMYNYVTNTIYNALPTEIKNLIINTTVVSSHGKNDENNFTSLNQKLYLLDKYEIDGLIITKNTASSTTRQLDYYRLNNNDSSRIKNGASGRWWTRTADSTSEYSFYCFIYDGSSGTLLARGASDVSPAFRIG